MKKLITPLFTLFVFLSFSSQTNAQLEARAGLVFAKLKTSLIGVTVSSDNRIGAQLGVTYNKVINEKFSFRPGLMYTMKGGEFSDDTETTGGTLGYVGIPLDFVYSTPVNDYTLSFHAGPYIDYLLHGTDNATDALKSTDFGFNIGAGFNMGQIGFGLNFSNGLSNISEEEIDDGGGIIIDLGDITQKNSFTSLYLTYAL